MLTETDGYNYVLTTIDGWDPQEWNIDEIVSELREIADGWDFTRISEQQYWSVIEKWHLYSTGRHTQVAAPGTDAQNIVIDGPLIPMDSDRKVSPMLVIGILAIVILVAILLGLVSGL